MHDQKNYGIYQVRVSSKLLHRISSVTATVDADFGNGEDSEVVTVNSGVVAVRKLQGNAPILYKKLLAQIGYHQISVPCIKHL